MGAGLLCWLPLQGHVLAVKTGAFRQLPAPCNSLQGKADPAPPAFRDTHCLYTGSALTAKLYDALKRAPWANGVGSTLEARALPAKPAAHHARSRAPAFSLPNSPISDRVGHTSSLANKTEPQA